jgi:hypothetical protein
LSWRPPRREEEFPVGILAKLMTEDAETAGRVAKLPGRMGGGVALDEKGAEGLILAVDGVFRFQEEGRDLLD